VQERQQYGMKVTLRGSQPRIWRRFEVPADVTLHQLHRILQVVMGWTDSHLHQFRRGNSCYGQSDPEFGVRRINERKVRLQDVLLEPKDRMVYEYDFGDGWEHELVLEAITSTSGEGQAVRVHQGQGACPPEDVGGIWGYHEFLEALGNPKHPHHHDIADWWGGPFDSQAFDIDGMKSRPCEIPAKAARLARVCRRRRDFRQHRCEACAPLPQVLQYAAGRRC